MQTSINVVRAKEAINAIGNPPPRPTPPEIVVVKVGWLDSQFIGMLVGVAFAMSAGMILGFIIGRQS